MDELITDYDSLEWKNINARDINSLMAGRTLLYVDPIYTDSRKDIIDGVQFYFKEQDGSILVVDISINQKAEDELETMLARFRTSGKK